MIDEALSSLLSEMKGWLRGLIEEGELVANLRAKLAAELDPGGQSL